jgi:ElaB/YqjD/DUF883 family membrane-anchored ribosome-binding protein
MSWWSIEKDLRARISELEAILEESQHEVSECNKEIRSLNKDVIEGWKRYENAIDERDRARSVAGTMLVWAQAANSLMADNPWMAEHPGVHIPQQSE